MCTSLIGLLKYKKVLDRGYQPARAHDTRLIGINLSDLGQGIRKQINTIDLLTV